MDTLKSENELMAFKNIFNDWYARDTSKKIRAVSKAKGQSGKPLSLPIYGYKASEEDKHKWIIDDEPAAVVRKIYKLCISGYGPTQIARKLTEEGKSQIRRLTLYRREETQPTRIQGLTAGVLKLSLTF